MLTAAELEREVDRELAAYGVMLEEFAKFRLGRSFSAILGFVSQHYPEAYGFYVASARRLLALGFPLPAKEILSVCVTRGAPPESVMRQIKSLLEACLEAAQSAVGGEER